MSRNKRSNREKRGAHLFDVTHSVLPAEADEFFSTEKSTGYLSQTGDKHLFIVGRAYNEPQHFNFIEDLLLGRQYIID